MKTASFDIITAAGNGYTSVWAERRYLAKLTLFPILIKFICFTTILSLDLEGNHLRGTLVLLPSYMAEGWMLAHWVRFIVLGQRWPFTPTGDDDKDMADLDDRARGVLGGMIVFVLIQMFIAATWAVVSALPVTEESVQAPTMEVRLMSVAVFVFMLWAFRFLWLFIPAATNYSILQYVKDVSHPKLSLMMVGVWLICAVPGFALMMGASMPVIWAADEQDVPALLEFMATGVQVVLEVLVNLLVTAGIAYGLKDMYARMNGKKK